MTYAAIHKGSLENPEAFWLEAAKEVSWYKKPTKAFDETQGVYGHWFTDATCNTCYNTIDRHVENGRGKQTALIYDSPLANEQQTFTYAQTLNEIEKIACMLIRFGITKGDRVIIYMPMVPQTVFAMLACARLGAIHSVVFGGFAAKELATRINDAKPKLILTASCGLEPGRIVQYKPLVDHALELAHHHVEAIILLQRKEHMVELQSPYYDWQTLCQAANENPQAVPCVPLKATDPLYILYTSGTTGIPKGVVRDNGSMMVALIWSMANVYGISPGQCFWAASDVGWVVGHSYIVYGPLLHGCTTILYEGKPVGTPDAGAFWRVISQYNVRALFTAPTAFRAIKKEDFAGNELKKYDISCLKTLFLAGERADPDTIQWAEKLLNVPVIDHWWQTETGWAIAGNPVGVELKPVKYGSATHAMPGYNVQIVDEGCHPLPAGKMGSIVIKLPMPPGCLPTLWQQDDRFIEGYLTEFPGFYKTADAGYIDEEGYIFVMGRTDDIINTAGHRLSTGAMEEVVSAHKDVAECAVLGIKDELKGEIPVGFVILKSGANNPNIEKELIRDVRDQIGPVAAFKTVYVVHRLPKTRSGKILRGTIKKIMDGDPWSMPATIDDPVILDEIIALVHT